MDTEKEKIIALLYAFVAQGPRLDFANYGDTAAYRSDARSITKDFGEARQLIRAIELRDAISADMLIRAFSDAYCGRLSYDGKALDYCVGQYWPTEYRAATCAVCASALWSWAREFGCAPAKDGQSPGSALRAFFKREFGRGMASRWFS